MQIIKKRTCEDRGLLRPVLIVFYIMLALAIFGISCLAGLFHYYSDELPPLSELKHYDLKIGSKVFDRNDNLIHTFAVERRTYSPLSEIPPYMVDALLATEDTNFYRHWGVDLYGLTRALLIDVLHFDFSQGASTISQQLSRNLFLTLDKTIPRKVKEALLAVQIEKMYSKDEILELYFNKVPFGIGIYGVSSAAMIYFNKKPVELTVPEAALIVGITQLPGRYDPTRHPERAVQRRNVVLMRMRDEGFITGDDFDQYVNEPLNLYHDKANRSADDYFIEYIRKILEDRYGTTKLFAGGLSIYTTLDIDLTRYADSALNKHLIEFEEKNEYEVKYNDFPRDTTDIVTPYVQGGSIVMDAETGAVRVMIGGRNFNHSKFNRMVHARRPPGSSFKPIIYTTALEKGYTAATVIDDKPVYFIQGDSVFWAPHNYTEDHFGYTRLRDGLRKSRNVYSVKTLADIGPRSVVRKARQFGITTSLIPVYSLAVGSMEVQPLEMISAYTTFPNLGERVTPFFVRRVEDSDGTILEEASVERIRVTDEKIAYMMVNLMQSVTEPGGTGAGIRWRGYRWAAGAKTGTTDDYRDAWFIGYNRELVAGIWVGFDDNSSLGEKQTGASAALPPWPYIMKYALEKDAPLNAQGNSVIDGTVLDFKRPDGLINVEISARTGLLPKNYYEERINEVFIMGTQPTPLSDSLNYNFYPTRYRESDKECTYFLLDRDPAILDSLDLSDGDIYYPEP